MNQPDLGAIMRRPPTRGGYYSPAEGDDWEREDYDASFQRDNPVVEQFRKAGFTVGLNKHGQATTPGWAWNLYRRTHSDEEFHAAIAAGAEAVWRLGGLRPNGP